MKPNPEDVRQMVAALMTLMGSLERARRQGDANTLAVLHILAVRQQARPSEIALEIGVHQSTITRQIQMLESSGFVQITVDPEDRRSCFVQLTEAGLSEVERLTAVGLSRFEMFVADWDAEEVQMLGRLLTKLETSKAAVATPEPRRAGRHWQKKGEGDGQ